MGNKNRKNKKTKHKTLPQERTSNLTPSSLSQEPISEAKKIWSQIERTYKIEPFKKWRVNPNESGLSSQDLWIAHVGGSLPIRENSDGDYILETSYSHKRQTQDQLMIGGQLCVLPLTDPRDTKHFTISCTVHSHMDRNADIYYDVRDYGIIIPDFDDFVEQNTIIDVKSNDLVTLGNAKLKDFILFAPYHERERFEKQYPDVQIVYHNGNIEDCMEQFAIEKLHKPKMNYSPNGWVKDKEKDTTKENALKDIIYEKGLPYLEPYLFQGSTYMGLEDSRRAVLMAVELIEFVKQHHLDDSKINIHNLVDIIMVGRLTNISVSEPHAYGSNVTELMFLRAVYEIFRDKGIEIPAGFCDLIKQSSGYTYQTIAFNSASCQKINPNSRDVYSRAAIATFKESMKTSYSTDKMRCTLYAEGPYYAQPAFMYNGLSFLIEKLQERNRSNTSSTRPGIKEMLEAGFISPENELTQKGVIPNDEQPVQ